MKEILCFGDSNTHGYIPGVGTRYPSDIRWSGRLSGLLGNEYHVIEEGMNGRTTDFEDELQPYRSALGYIDPCLKSHAPLDLVIIMLGTNDTKCRYRVSAEEIGFGMRELIHHIRSFFTFNSSQAGPCPRILILSPVPMPDTGGDPEMDEASLEKQRRLPEVYRSIALENDCAFAEAGKWIGPELLGSDCCHLSPEAHSILAERIAELVRKLIG